MDFSLTVEQKLVKKAARDFARTEIEPLVEQIERENEVPRELVFKMGKAGFLGMNLPREYGGGDSGFLNYILAIEELRYPGVHVTLHMAMASMVGLHVLKYGTPEMAERYLRPMCTGDMVGSFVFTEPATGSDPKSLATRAERDGDYWVLNGIKRFHTMGNHYGPAMIFAVADGTKPTAFIVEKDQEGYSCSKPYELMGGAGCQTVDTRLHNVRVHKSRVIGEIGKGFDILLEAATVSKLGLAIESVALAQAALDEAVRYAKQRTRRGVPIGSMQAIQWLLAEIAVRVETARLLTYRTASLKEQGANILKEAAMCKLFASHAGKEAVDMSMQVHGSYGYTKDFKIERLYRDAKENELIEGTNEVQRSIIGSALMM